MTEIQEFAFYNCTKLTEIRLSQALVSVGQSAFSECDSLYGKYSYARYVGDAENPYAILIGPDIDRETYKIHGETKIIAGSAFAAWESLSSVAIPDSVTSIGGGAFSYCTSLTSVTIPDSVTSIGDNAFAVCESLTSITIGDSVTSIGDSAFSFCTSLTSITIPDSVTSIGDSAFLLCESLTNVTIPDSVTSIDNHAFESCTSLTSVTIPESVTSIDDDAFKGCESLTIIYYGSTESAWNTIDFGFFLYEDLSDVMLYFYSANGPTASGNYWHYDENGEIAVWKNN